jgi:hypothetical protein
MTKEDELETDALMRGQEWYNKHKGHVLRLLENNPSAPPIQPTGSDLTRPELWMDIHWQWFFSRKPQFEG